MSEVVLRPATVADAAAVAAVTCAGLETYRAFAPAGWQPPPLATEVDGVLAGLGSDDVWWIVADAGDEVLGHAAFIPARASVHPVDDSALAHVRAVFVAPVAWGTGLATRLLDAAVDAARAQSYERMRLFTPEAQVRARRFYEREGWSLVGAPNHEPALGLSLVEYRRDV